MEISRVIVRQEFGHDVTIKDIASDLGTLKSMLDKGYTLFAKNVFQFGAVPIRTNKNGLLTPYVEYILIK